MLQQSVLDASPRPTMYCRHQNFLDFTEFFSDQPHPTYFSFVRNPVERQISWYYYLRNSLRLFQNQSETMEALALNNDNPNPRELKESFEDCIAKQRRHCRWIPGTSIKRAGPSHISQMSYFCGHHPDCDIFESEGLFQRAVENFEKQYAVTGVLGSIYIIHITQTMYLLYCTTLPAEVENNLKVPLHMDYLVLF